MARLDFDIDDAELIRKHGISTHFLKYVCASLLAMAALAAYMSVSYRVTLSVQGKGRLEPLNTHSIRARVPGVIQNIYCQENDLVEENQLLVEVYDRRWDQDIKRIEEEIRINDSRRRELQIKIHQEHAEHQLATQIAALELDALYIRRDRILAEHQIYTASASSLRRKPLQHLFPVKSIKAAIREKEAHLELARLRCSVVAIFEQEMVTLEQVQRKYEKDVTFIREEMTRGIVLAPAPGMIVGQDLSLRVGKYVNLGEEILQISETAGWQGTIFVTEGDRPKITPGLPAQVYLHAFPHRDYRILDGTVGSLGQNPADHPRVKGVSYPIYIRLSDPWIIDEGDTLSLAEGMSIDARIVVEEGTIQQILQRKFLQSTGVLDKANPLSALLLN